MCLERKTPASTFEMPHDEQEIHASTSQHFKIHAKLDAIGLQAYSFNPSDDWLRKLLTLNLESAEQKRRGEAVIGS